MDETLSELIHNLESSEGSPLPEVVEALFDCGAEAVEPLRALVRRGCSDPDGTPYDYIAVGILGDLKAKDAVEDLLETIRRGDED
jgi:hypothetical protein